MNYLNGRPVSEKDFNREIIKECHAVKRATAKQRKRQVDRWMILRQLIDEFAEAKINDSFKGGLDLAGLRLAVHIENMRLHYEEKSQ
jgi:hypothetical protein